MRVLTLMMNYVRYYLLTTLLISFFADPSIKEWLIMICEAAISISMFASIFELIFGGYLGDFANNISTWCLRGVCITTIITVIAGIGVHKIARVFGG